MPRALQTLRVIAGGAAVAAALALSPGASAASLAPVLVPYTQLQRSTGFRRTLADAVRYSADWRAYFASSALTHRWLLKVIGHWNEVLFPFSFSRWRRPMPVRGGPLANGEQRELRAFGRTR